jgi:hypothetical protein
MRHNLALHNKHKQEAKKAGSAKDNRLGHARRCRDLACGCAIKTLAGKKIHCHLDQLFAAFVGRKSYGRRVLA